MDISFEDPLLTDEDDPSVRFRFGIWVWSFLFAPLMFVMILIDTRGAPKLSQTVTLAGLTFIWLPTAVLIHSNWHVISGAYWGSIAFLVALIPRIHWTAPDLITVSYLVGIGALSAAMFLAGGDA